MKLTQVKRSGIGASITVMSHGTLSIERDEHTHQRFPSAIFNQISVITI